MVAVAGGVAVNRDPWCWWCSIQWRRQLRICWFPILGNEREPRMELVLRWEVTMISKYYIKFSLFAWNENSSSCDVNSQLCSVKSIISPLHISLPWTNFLAEWSFQPSCFRNWVHFQNISEYKKNLNLLVLLLYCSSASILYGCRIQLKK